MHRVVFVGPPGAGKGTQAAILARALGIVHLSTGDVLRSAVSERTDLGLQADGFMRAGQLVPDALVLKIIGDRLHRPSAREGFLLDGFPRNVAQAEALAQITPLDRVIAFQIPEALLLERLTQRWSCPKCARAYNAATQPPKSAGRCDDDGTALVQRPDDRPEAVRTRLKVYQEQTAPLLAFYRALGLLRTVDAVGEVDEVAARLRALFVGRPAPAEDF